MTEGDSHLGIIVLILVLVTNKFNRNITFVSSAVISCNYRLYFLILSKQIVFFHIYRLYSAALSSVRRWKSSFKPVDGEDDDYQDQSTSSPQRDGLYDPYDPVSSDSDLESRQAENHNHFPPSQDNNLERQRLSPGGGFCDNRRWDSSYCEPARLSGPLDQRGRSPDDRIHGSSTQQFPASYGGQRTNGEERITPPEYRREMSTTVRLSPPRLQRDYQHQLPYVDTGLDRDPSPTKVMRNKTITVITDNPITCDLCEVELTSGQELEEHLDSKTHWDTLEHIQQNNNYDDLTIAFLQEAMLYKSRQCSRAIEDTALRALQENDHMTKVEMFHCAACKVFVSTSAPEVHAHITSKEHLSNTKEFEVQQRHACLSKAEAMMKELKPQFEHFLKGGSSFQ
ncbi:A-kinase anchor protein 8-like isoform X2 [Embiotoca jacksoni]|uniref:A-kinase anchor protein 8-like isoform X2 n=1 Tax=Embiotoca jacksoni TaxID=100190 RepID=UPI003703A0D5